jgi:hypothetical protein
MARRRTAWSARTELVYSCSYAPIWFAAMPRAAVADSEVSDGGAEFHFVLDDAARHPWADDTASPEPSQGGW